MKKINIDQLVVMSTESINPERKHKLQNTWALWYHDGKSDWTINSYQKIYEFDTVEDFWRLYNNLPSVVNSMFFLMKKGHPPIWEVPQNIRGGSWLYKFPKKIADSFWLKFSCYLVGETIADDMNNIIGISISPKVYNVTIRVWNCNSELAKNIKFNDNYTELVRGQPLYKEFVHPDKIINQLPPEETQQTETQKTETQKTETQPLQKTNHQLQKTEIQKTETQKTNHQPLQKTNHQNTKIINQNKSHQTKISQQEKQTKRGITG